MGTFTPDGQMQSTWHIRVGATFRKQYRWSTGTPAVPVDLTGWSGEAHIRLKETDEAYVLALSTEDGSITLGADGLITFDIDYGASGTELLASAKKAVFDFELTNPTATFRRNLIGGEVVIYGQRTRP